MVHFSIHIGYFPMTKSSFVILYHVKRQAQNLHHENFNSQRTCMERITKRMKEKKIFMSGLRPS